MACRWVQLVLLPLPRVAPEELLLLGEGSGMMMNILEGMLWAGFCCWCFASLEKEGKDPREEEAAVLGS